MVDLFGTKKIALLEAQLLALQQENENLHTTNQTLNQTLTNTNQRLTTVQQEYLAQKVKPRILDRAVYEESLYNNGVLVVDDEEIWRGQVGGIALAFGFEPTYAASVEQAIIKLSMRQYKILVTDGDMPKVGEGLKLLREIKTKPHYNSIETIMYSGNPVHQQEVEQLGGTFIKKFPRELAEYFLQRTTLF